MALQAFRIEFTDQPGMLGRLGAALGTCGANIMAVDIHELDGDQVIDEVVVEAGSASPQVLRQALLDAGASSVASATVAHRLTDSIVACLDAVARLAGAPPGDPDDDNEALSALAMRMAGADTRAIVGVGEASGVAARALETGVPSVARAVADDVSGSRWLLALPHPEHAPVVVLVLGRSSGVRFSATEVGRARAALRCGAQLHARRTSS